MSALASQNNREGSSPGARANDGDLAKEAGLFPWLAVTPDNASR